jgi:hypothetical protein
VAVARTTCGLISLYVLFAHQSPPPKTFYDKVNKINSFEEPCNTVVMACNIRAVRDHKISPRKYIKLPRDSLMFEFFFC